MGKYALLIGVDEYGEGLQPLPAAPNDVEALADVLRNPAMGGFDEVKPLLNPSQPDMAREIELWFQGREPDDLVLLFFSGHGVKDDDRSLYFASSSTEKVRNRLLTSTATSARFVSQHIRRCKAKYQVVILDCCFSGAFGDLVARDDGEVGLQEQLGAEGRVVLTSTSSVDYSFEEKGKDLSIYTRYLVEGIATGAADANGDGWIAVEELHRYASGKVKETSPVMSPDIITLKGQGYDILLARASQDDPRLKYRKEMEKRARQGKFSAAARRLLARLQLELGVSEADAEAIKTEVLKPFRDYQLKLHEYREALKECLTEERELSSGTISDMVDYRVHLGLKPEDVEPIEQELIGSTLEKAIPIKQNQVVEQELEEFTAVERSGDMSKMTAKLNQLLATERPLNLNRDAQQREADDDLASEKGIDYRRLRDLLKAEQWEEADQETADRMLEAMAKKSWGDVTSEDLLNFPCADLKTIDGLWVTCSDGRFGFSVQKEIYVECGATLDGEYPGSEIWGKFCDRIGWRVNGSYISYDEVTFNTAAPRGHLPVGGGFTGWFLASPTLGAWARGVVFGGVSSLLSHRDL